MPRRLPPLNALKAFEAAARYESFTRAAEELCVTQGAVSHQVKALEAELGLKLFNRERQRLIITEAGRNYLEVVRDAFDRIAAGTERLLQRQSAGALTVSTSPNFAAKWLVHRLARFAEAHPGIDLRISASMHHVDFAHEDVDLAIRHGDGRTAGLHVTRLCAEELMPVCSPKLISGRHAVRGPADLARHTLLHVNDRSEWSKWLDVYRRNSDRLCQRARVQPGQHGARCRCRWSGHRAGTVGAGRVGSDRWSIGSSVQAVVAIALCLLDRLPEGDRQTAEDRYLPRLAAVGGCFR